MGRKRMEIKKVTVGLSIRKDIVDFFRENKMNMSAFCQDCMLRYMEKENVSKKKL